MPWFWAMAFKAFLCRTSARVNLPAKKNAVITKNKEIVKSTPGSAFILMVSVEESMLVILFITPLILKGAGDSLAARLIAIKQASKIKANIHMTIVEAWRAKMMKKKI